MHLVPKKWAEFQHYKDRSPPWIKLHRDLLNDRVFMGLPLASKALAPLLWLLASESKDGAFDADHEELAFRLRVTEDQVAEGLVPLISKGFFLDASTMLAPCLQTAIPEREGETEAEKEVEKKAPVKRTPPTPPIPAPQDVDQQTWADWLHLRKTKKAPVTPTVVEGARSEAGKAGLSLEDFLKVWCRRGSQGLEASWLKPNERPQQSQPKTFTERDREAGMARWEEQTGRTHPDRIKPGDASGRTIDITSTILEIAQ